MKWGIFFLAWFLTGVYLASGCLDHVRAWQKPPPGYTRERIVPHLEFCAKQQAQRFAGLTVGLVALYYGSGWLSTRLRAVASPDASEVGPPEEE